MIDACVQLADAAAAHDRQVRWATVSFALGAAAGVSTIVYGLLAGSERGGHGSVAPSAQGPRLLGISVGERGTQLVLDGSF
jgi:hypothetical protein